MLFALLLIVFPTQSFSQEYVYVPKYVIIASINKEIPNSCTCTTDGKTLNCDPFVYCKKELKKD